jgi:predicted SnoaL-like aldol condensation-catalyzing enzyme
MNYKLAILAATLLAGATLFAVPAAAQMQPLSEPVVAHPDPESLFASEDPALHRNKQAALHIVKELLQCNQWDRAGEWLTDRYIQHNPFAASGLEAVVHYFVDVAKREPTPTCDKLSAPVVAVQAEGDFVSVMFVRTLPVPGGEEGKTYSTTWFDAWRFVDGKADEHWDPATLPPVSAPSAE